SFVFLLFSKLLTALILQTYLSHFYVTAFHHSKNRSSLCGVNNFSAGRMYRHPAKYGACQIRADSRAQSPRGSPKTVGDGSTRRQFHHRRNPTCFLPSSRKSYTDHVREAGSQLLDPMDRLRY